MDKYSMTKRAEKASGNGLEWQFRGEGGGQKGHGKRGAGPRYLVAQGERPEWSVRPLVEAQTRNASAAKT